MMDRRRFLLTSLGGALAAPLAAGAQPPAPRLGVLVAGSPDTAAFNVSAFQEALRELGYVEGVSVAIDYRYDYGRGEAVPGIADLVKANVAVIVAAGGPLARAAKRATLTIPIVFVAAGDPVGFGIVTSLARPGGNVTGLSLIIDADFMGKWVELLKETAPGIAGVGYIHDSNMRLPTQEERQAAERWRIRYVEVADLSEIDRTLAGMSKDRSGVIVPPQSSFSTTSPRDRRTRGQAQAPGDLWVPGLRGRRRASVVRAQPARRLASGRGLCRQDPQGHQARRPASGTADEVRVGDQPQDRQGPRPHDPAVYSRAT
jgi:putative ABC transport system substrate-binding protein